MRTIHHAHDIVIVPAIRKMEATMKRILAPIVLIAMINVSVAWMREAARADMLFKKCESAEAIQSGKICKWTEAIRPTSNVRVAQLGHCCAGSKKLDDDTFECAYAVTTGTSASCSYILAKNGYFHVFFDGYTEADCIARILATSWC